MFRCIQNEGLGNTTSDEIVRVPSADDGDANSGLVRRTTTDSIASSAGADYFIDLDSRNSSIEDREVQIEVASGDSDEERADER